MIIGKQLNSSSFSPMAGWAHRRTSTLLDSGLVAIAAGSGLVTHTTLGADVLHRVRELVAAALVRINHALLLLPQIMSDDDLRSGEPVGDQFARKVMSLGETLPGHHLIISPETATITRCTQAGLTDVICAKKRRPGEPKAKAHKRDTSGPTSKTRHTLGMRWPVERTNSWFSNFGQLRRNTDRFQSQRLAGLPQMMGTRSTEIRGLTCANAVLGVTGSFYYRLPRRGAGWAGVLSWWGR